MAATWILSIGLISIDNFGLTERLKVTEDLKLTEENEHAKRSKEERLIASRLLQTGPSVIQPASQFIQFSGRFLIFVWVQMGIGVWRCLYGFMP